MAAFWIIGDIHGMYDPLHFLITQTRLWEKALPEQVSKYIFLGDYIDHGPSSKQVLDLLMDLHKPAVFLAGNHEDLMLHFLHDTSVNAKHPNAWFANGAINTLLSFHDDPDDLYLIAKISKLQSGEDDEGLEDIAREKLRNLDSKYLNFFENLVYGHKETVEINGSIVNLAFVHAGIMPLPRRKIFPEEELILFFGITPQYIDEQIKPRKFNEYFEFCQSLGLDANETSIWIRKWPEVKTGNYIIIHGHTPVAIETHFERESSGEIESFDDRQFYPKFVFDEYAKPHRLNSLVRINLDTGAVYNNALTALYFSTEMISKDMRVMFLQVRVDRSYRFWNFVYDEIILMP